MIKKIILIILLFAQPVFAAPTINSVSGAVANGQSVVISTTGAGSTGPNILIYDDFEGNSGDVVSLSAPVGTWAAHGANTPKYSSAYAHSGNTSDLACLNEVGNRLKATYSPTDKVYLSYWTYLPSDKYFPGASDILTISDVSAWKMAWFVNDGSTYVNDLVNLSSVNPWWLTGGNNLSFGDAGRVARNPAYAPYESFFVFGEWFRVSTWVKSGEMPQTDMGFIKTETLSATNGMYQKQNDVVVFGNVSAQAPYTWNELWLPGWQINQDSPDAYDTTFYHDDVYIASGDGAAARVEIGNDPVYSECTNLSVCTVTSWADSSVAATVRVGSLSGPAYLFVVDADGVASAGKLVNLSGTPAYDPPAITGPDDFSTAASSVEIEGPYAVDPDLPDQSVIVTWTLGEASGFAVAALGVFSCTVPIELGAHSVVFRVVDSNDSEDSDTTVVTRTATQDGFIYTGSMSGGTYR